jgi:hypothetical protein
MENNIKRNAWRFMRLLTVLLLLISGGCAGLNQDLQYRRPVVFNPAYVRDTDVCRISVDPIFNSSRGKSIFGYDPERLGILPIHIAIDNTSKDLSLVIQKNQVQLFAFPAKNSTATKESMVYGAETEGTIGVRTITAGQRALDVVAGIVFGLGGHLTEYSSEINHNFAREELLDMSVPPGQSINGCVYFRLPDRRSVERYRLEVTVIQFGTKKKHLTDFDITSAQGS